MPFVAPSVVVLVANFEPKKGLADALALPFDGRVPLGKLASSSWQINISSQCSSFKIESYVTHSAGPLSFFN